MYNVFIYYDTYIKSLCWYNTQFKNYKPRKEKRKTRTKGLVKINEGFTDQRDVQWVRHLPCTWQT